MVKVVFVVHKRADLDREAFARYWHEVHAPIAAKIPGLRKYTINPARAGGSGAPPLFDGVAELYFDSAEASEAGFASPQGQAAFSDAANFLDMARLRSVVADEI